VLGYGTSAIHVSIRFHFIGVLTANGVHPRMGGAGP
jgi:hypothetical protein